MDFLTYNATRRKERVRWADETGDGVLEVVYLIEALEDSFQEDEEEEEKEEEQEKEQEDISEEESLKIEQSVEARWKQISDNKTVPRATKYAFAASLGGEAFPGKSRLEEMIRTDMFKRGPIEEEEESFVAESGAVEEVCVKQPAYSSKYKRNEKDDVHKKLAEALEELSIVRDELISANEKVSIQQKRIFEYESILKEKDNEISGYLKEIEEKNRIIEFLVRRSGESNNVMAMVNGRRWSDLLDSRNNSTNRGEKGRRELVDSPRSIASMVGHSRLNDLKAVGPPVAPVVRTAESRENLTKATFPSTIGVNRLQELKHK